MKNSQYLWLAISAAAALAGAAANANPGSFSGAPPKLIGRAAAAAPEEVITQLIVKPRQQAGSKLIGALHANNAEALSHAANAAMSVVRPMSGNAHVVRLDTPVSLSEAKVIAARLMREDAIELAEPDRIVHPVTLPPNDPRYSDQWHFYSPAAQNRGGANLPGAWAITHGSEHITVAVIDTGIRPHADLGTLLPGYDFINDAVIANDGNGRDADASDPGDAVAANECGTTHAARNSSWHGTHVAGTVAALLNNGVGVAGIAPAVKILPVRVLGKCGGYTSDVIDGMRWAAGLAVNGVPSNPKPAHVLNLSLGRGGVCSNAFQSAVNDVLSAGKLVVAAAGNDAALGVSQPANCSGALAVTAHAVDGDNASYANIGPEVALSAPGGGCGTVSLSSGTCVPSVNGMQVLSLGNAGAGAPGADDYQLQMGTSMAAPHVSGVAALLLSAYQLTPAQLRSHLQSSARPHPADTSCATSFAGNCGAGLLDAVQAFSAAAAPTASVTDPVQVVAPNAVVTLAGAGSATTGRSVTSYAWSQISGAPVGAIANANTPNASITAGTTGTVSFQLTVTDNTGATGKATAIVRANSAPVLTALPDQRFAAGATASFQVGATDADGDSLIFHSVSIPPGATLSASGLFTWPDAPAGNYAMSYYASDEAAQSAVATVNITIASSGSGGGGSMGGTPLLLLTMLAAGARLRRLFSSR